MQKRTVLLPFTMTCSPLTKLALINFDKDPDSIYSGLELQYLDGQPLGTGWRILAYRLDGYVDVYDDDRLNGVVDEEGFQVAGNGMANYNQQNLSLTRFEKDNGKIHIQFTFLDIQNREISVKVMEHSNKMSKDMHLLAPVGVSSVHPHYLPLFFLYEFDFVRRANTEMEIIIDGMKKKPDSFPALKDYQRRYYSRYSMDSQIIEFAKATDTTLEEVDLDDDLTYTQDQTTYYFGLGSTGLELKTIQLNHSIHPVTFHFNEPMPAIYENSNISHTSGNFYIDAGSYMGSIKGEYTLEMKDSIAKLSMLPNEGWEAVPNSLLTKMIFVRKSVFRSWPKTYKYTQEINLTTYQSKSSWQRI